MIIYPSVFSPEFYISSKIFANYILSMDNLQGKSILDMGCGSGIISILCAVKGAMCTALDINTEAVKSANENFMNNNVNVSASESDLFNSIDPSKKFDIIFFNPPYYEYEPRNDFEKGFGGGEGYKVIKDFVAKSKNYLTSNGYLCLIVSTDMKMESMFSILKENGFEYYILEKTEKFFETFYILKAFINLYNDEI